MMAAPSDQQEDRRAALRRRVLAARDALPAAARQEKSQLIAEHLLASPLLAAARTIMAYVAFRSEVATLPLIAALLAAGRTVAVPRTLIAARRLVPHRLATPETDLAPGAYGIGEPVPERTPVLDPGGIDLVLVPGSVFDPAGGRLGYGGGFYDRFLARDCPRATTVGLAFELQVVAQVPLLPHDRRLDYVVTETRLLGGLP
ncbi:MAG: 5-formyltetrahydrofolate cyclo-ligase [Thermodesulfobacteriota bacterium]